MHVPATVATNPYRGNICFAGQCSGAAGGCLRGVIHDCGDVRREEGDAGINKLNGSKGAVFMELLYEG